MARRCETCAHFSADLYPMCAAPQRGERIVISYFARSLFTDCGPDAAWHAPSRPSLLRRILARLGAA